MTIGKRRIQALSVHFTGPKMSKTMFALMVSVMCLGTIPAMAQEMPEDMRGEWVADINPTTKDMFVTDCPCESDNGSLEMTCAPKSGTVRIEMKDFLTDKAKTGDKAVVAFDIDGQKSERDAAMAAYTDGFVMPAFETTTDDPLFATLSSGNSLSLTHGDKTAQTRLKGSKKAMAAMIGHCGK